MSLPEGFGQVPGRSRATAKKLLAAADAVGVDQTLISSNREGYLVPEAVLDYYDEHLADEDVAIETPTSDAAPFARVETNHEPLTFDTLHEEEKEGGVAEPKAEGEVTPSETVTSPASTTAPAADGEQTNEDGTPVTGEAATGAGEITAEDEKPAGNASKDAWADWAAKWHQYDKAEDLSRDDLRAKFDPAQ